MKYSKSFHILRAQTTWRNCAHIHTLGQEAQEEGEVRLQDIHAGIAIHSSLLVSSASIKCLINKELLLEKR